MISKNTDTHFSLSNPTVLKHMHFRLSFWYFIVVLGKWSLAKLTAYDKLRWSHFPHTRSRTLHSYTNTYTSTHTPATDKQILSEENILSTANGTSNGGHIFTQFSLAHPTTRNTPQHTRVNGYNDAPHCDSHNGRQDDNVSNMKRIVKRKRVYIWNKCPSITNHLNPPIM